MISRLFFLCLFLPYLCCSQTLTGKVIDKATQQPLETVAVYFDNTTIGTTTNEKGEFSITYTDAIQSSLVFSYLGYEKVLMSDYRQQKAVTIEMVPASFVLDEVYLDDDDGLTRKQKLKLFKREFLGTSKFAKSCKILNESDLILRYDKRSKALYASAKVPIKIANKALQYQIDYDLIDFEVTYRYVNIKTNEFVMQSATYFGTTFYKDLKGSIKKKTIKNREKVYKGSVQHFIRSLYNENLKDEDYWIFYDKFRVDEWSYFKIEAVEDSVFKKVKLDTKVTILYNKDRQSDIQLNIPEFYIDMYGNYTPIIGVYFSGAMGDQRVGDALPLDYNLRE